MKPKFFLSIAASEEMLEILFRYDNKASISKPRITLYITDIRLAQILFKETFT